MDFAGQVDNVQGDTITVEGITIHIGTDQPLAERPQVGDRVGS